MAPKSHKFALSAVSPVVQIQKLLPGQDTNRSPYAASLLTACNDYQRFSIAGLLEGSLAAESQEVVRQAARSPFA